jgi:hypothetical protein
MSRTNARPRPHCYRKPLRPALSQHPRTTTALCPFPVSQLYPELDDLYQGFRSAPTLMPREHLAIRVPVRRYQTLSHWSMQVSLHVPYPPGRLAGASRWGALTEASD